jgi:SP family sugar:H+ symporter-like MFS transporter
MSSSNDFSAVSPEHNTTDKIHQEHPEHREYNGNNNNNNDNDNITPHLTNPLAEKGVDLVDSPIPLLTWRSVIMGILVSMGGFIFGYDTGQISGFLETKDFLQRFGEWNGTEFAFTNVRSGLIVALVCFYFCSKVY